MIDKEKFYNEEDYPLPGTKQIIWKQIKKNIKPESAHVFSLHRMPGFYYGFAAAIILFFAFYGLYSFGRNIVYENKPEEIKLNSAYQSAIKEFENIVPAVVSNIQQKNEKRDVLFIKMEQLQSVNEAILKLNKENINHDISPLKQLSLHNLYIIKLKILQEILEQGEITL